MTWLKYPTDGILNAVIDYWSPTTSLATRARQVRRATGFGLRRALATLGG